MTYRCLSRIVAMLWLTICAMQAQAVRVAVISDTQGFSGDDCPYNERLLPLQVETLLKIQPRVDAALVCGDLIHGQDTPDAVIADLRAWRQAVQPLVDAGIAVYPVPGNHDLTPAVGFDVPWQTVFSDLPANGPADELHMTYSFDIGSAHFAAVCNDSPTNRHRTNSAWLANDLANSDANGTAKVKIVFGHDPAFPDSRHIGDSLDQHPEDRDIFWQTLIDNDVKLYLSGHEHNYDHWINTGVHQIICDGSDKFGFSYRYVLMDIADDGQTHVTVKRINGIVCDEFDLSDLSSGATDDRGGNASPKAVQPVRVAVLADTQQIGDDACPYNERSLPLQIDAILAANPPINAVLVCGDLINGRGSSSDIADQFRTWREAMQPLADADIAVYPVPGNHDMPNLLGYDVAWQSVFCDLPRNGPTDELYMTYSFDIGAAHFVAVANETPTNRHRVNSDWLADDLATSSAKTKIVFGHDPAFPANNHIGYSLDYHPLLRDIFWQTLIDNDVKLYLSGHEHIYDHWANSGVHQIVCDGGEKPGLTYRLPILDIDADGNTVVTVAQLDGTIVEQFNLSDTTNVPNEDRHDNTTLFYDAVTACPVAAMMLMAGCFAASTSLDTQRKATRRTTHA